MKDDDKCLLLADHVDQLLVMCSLKLRMTHGRHFESGDNVAVEEALQCYRALLATIISVRMRRCVNRTHVNVSVPTTVLNISYVTHNALEVFPSSG